MTSETVAKKILVLASASPRRSELLRQAGVEIALVQAADIDESRKGAEAPYEYVLRLAREKASVVAEQHPNSVVLAADTTVVLGDPLELNAEILGKPESEGEAIEMLERLSGRSHEVLSGVALEQRSSGVSRSFVVRTTVYFRELSPREIRKYCASDEPYDKAGAYAVQGSASSYVRSLEGSYTNVVGLPLAETVTALRPLLEECE